MTYYPTTKDAAKERAWRTFKQQFPVDIAVILIPLFIDVLANTGSWDSREYWVVVGVSVGKTVLGVLLSYVMRLKNPPETEQTRPAQIL